MREILTKEQRQEIKELLHVMNVGMTDFRYGCICNHREVENNIVTMKLTGFQGIGKTESVAVLNLIDDVWEHLSPEEKQRIDKILQAEEE